MQFFKRDFIGLGRQSILFFVVALVLIKFLASSLAAPHGAWDAWAIWNTHARFILQIGVDNVFRGDRFRTAFAPQLPHSDYPPLLPFLVAFSWRFTGIHSQAVPIGIAMLFTFGTAGLLYQTLTYLKLHTQAWLIGIALLITPDFSFEGTGQKADVPLGFFILACATSLVLYEREHRLRWLVLAGVLAGLALLTKNEGALFVVCLAIAYVKIWCRPREAQWFVLGILPFVLVLIYFKLVVQVPNDIVAGQGSETLSRLTTLSRYETVTRAFSQRLEWYAKISFLVVMYLLLTGARPAKQLFPIFLLVALMLCGYFFIYVITPKPLDWHLNTSLHRLVLHVWPTALLSYGLMGETHVFSADHESPVGQASG
jgi:4-amino-4-deoxy-L-arabinose transferase-like glycosyltransferase